MKNTLDTVLVRCQKGTFSVPDFLALNESQLTSFEREMRQSFAILYDLNGEKGLFKSFPNWNKSKPLMLDCCFRNTKSEGCYHPAQNLVEFGRQDRKEGWLDVLAHELKHAEQNDLYVYERTVGRPYNRLKKNHQVDAMSLHQIGFLMEAQAFAFDQYVQYLHMVKNKPKTVHLLTAFTKYMKSGILKNYSEYEQQFILDYLPRLFEQKTYKDYHDYKDTISEEDRGLSEIPVAFGLNPEYCQNQLLPALRKVPREARRPNLRCLQLLRDGHSEEAYRVLNQKNASGEYVIPPDERARLLREFPTKKYTVSEKDGTTQLRPFAPKKDLRNILGKLSQKIEILSNEIARCQTEISSLRFQQQQNLIKLNHLSVSVKEK